MTRKDHIALAAAMLETRPFVTENQYHRMKKNRGAPAYFLILQWENCVNALCRTLHRDNDAFSPATWLEAAGFITTSGRARVH